MAKMGHSTAGEARAVSMNKQISELAKKKKGPEGIWVKQEDGTYFPVKMKTSVHTERFREFVSELPPGAKVVPTPPMVNYSKEDLVKLGLMKEDHESLLEKGSVAYKMTMSVLDHPTLTLAQKQKKLWALRKQFKHAMVAKDRGRSLVQGDEGKEDKIRWGTRNPAAAEEVMRDVTARHRALEMDPEARQRALDGITEVNKWYASIDKCVLQANECSRLHALIELVTGGYAVGMKDGSALREIQSQRTAMFDHVQSFVVKHNWGAAFKDELGKVADEEVVLPFPTTAFEFKVNGRACTMLAIDPMSGVVEKARELQTELIGDAEGLDHGRHFYLFIAASNGSWISKTANQDYKNVFNFLVEQVKAICVMLDAKIAEYSVVKQPAALNAKRLKSGRLPLYDYRVVDLAKKYHKPSPGGGGESGIRQRCHLRRGHWVHSHHQPMADTQRETKRWTKHGDIWRTWVNWYLAGDPDLGFVEKEYKL